MQLINEEEDLVSNKCKLGLISRSFFVLGFVAICSATLQAQNPYDSAMANSQMAAYGNESSVQNAANGSAVSVPSVYENSAGGMNQSAMPGDPYANHVNNAYIQQTSAVEMGNTPRDAYAGAPAAQQGTVSPPVGQYAGYDTQVVYQEQPLYGAGYSTMPDYPRNNAFTPDAVSTPNPAPTYPQTKEEMVPERIHRDPPLTPYDSQETYSYVTETTTSSSTACQLCNEGYGNPYLWAVGGMAKVKHRQRIDKGSAAFFNNAGTFAITPNTNFSVAPGFEMNVSRYLGRNAFNYDIWADLSFDGLYEWEAEKTYYASEKLYSNFGIAGLSTVSYNVEVSSGTGSEGTETEGDAGTTAQAEEVTTETYSSIPGTLKMKYSADMNSANLVFRFRKRGRPDPLIGHPNGTWTRECQGGLRYTHLFGVNFTSYNEDLNWAGTADIYDSKNNWIGTENGYSYTDTQNNMLGLVLGGEFIDKHCVWAWGMRWKLSPYLNFMENKLSMNNTQGVDYRAKVSETDISYMAQWGIFATYKTGKYVTWRLGYDVSCFGNIALAGQNMMVEDSIRNNNYNIFQELSIGCTIAW